MRSPMVWIELDGKRVDVRSLAAAKRCIRKKWPDAVFLEPLQVDDQSVTHVHTKPRPLDDLYGPDAVIVEESRTD